MSVCVHPVGKVFAPTDNYIPHFHRGGSMVRDQLGFANDNEYVFLDINQGTIKYWDIPTNKEFDVPNCPSGISLMVLNDPQENPHGVFTTRLLGAGCHASNRLDPRLAAFVFEHIETRFGRKAKGPKQNHCYMFPTQALTLEQFIDAFLGPNPLNDWVVCGAVGYADDCDSEADPADDVGDDKFGSITTGDTTLIQLMKLLKSSAKKFSGSLRRHCLSVHNWVVAQAPGSFHNLLVEREAFAFRLYALIFWLEEMYCAEGLGRSVGALNITGPLLDAIDDCYNIGDKYEIVNITSQVNSAIIQRTKTQSDNTGEFSFTDVFNSCFSASLVTFRVHMHRRKFERSSLRGHLGRSLRCD